MRINTKQWKKINADDKFTYFQDLHKNELKVAHTTLSPKMRADLAALPVHMADGGMYGEPSDKKDDEEEDKKAEDESIKALGEVEPLPQMEKPAEPEMPTPAPSPEAAPSSPPVPQAMMADASMQPPPGVPAPTSAATPQPTVSRDPAAPAIAPEPSPQAADAAAASIIPKAPESIEQDELKLMSAAQNQQLSGIKHAADAMVKQAAAEQLAAEESRKAMQDVADHFQNDYKALVDEQKAIWNDVRGGHIDPDRVWGERSTGGKIATIIGVMLSGLGAGMSGQPNMAMDVLNKAIDRDIDAQKANLSHKNNMLSALSNQMGSLRAGADMTKNIQLSLAATKMQEAAAKSKDPLVRANMEQQIGMLKQQMVQTNAKLSAQQTVNKLTEAANKDPSKIPQLLAAMRKVNPAAAKEAEEKYVDGLGFARDAKGAEKLREAKTVMDGSLWSIGELKRINAMSKFDKGRPEIIGQAETYAQGLVGLLRPTILGPGVVDKNERKILEAIAADPTKVFSLSSSNLARYEALSKKMRADFAFAAKNNGINVPMPMSDDAKKKSFDAWARANPTNPKAQQYLKLQSK